MSVSEALLVSWGVCERGGLGGDSTRSPFHQDTQTPTRGRASQGRRVAAGPPPPTASAELRAQQQQGAVAPARAGPRNFAGMRMLAHLSQ